MSLTAFDPGYDSLSLTEFRRIPWLVSVCPHSTGSYQLELRSSLLYVSTKRCSFNRTVFRLCEARRFQRRVMLAFKLLSRYWLCTVRRFQPQIFLSPIPRELHIAASWLLARDFSDKGTAYLHMVLRDVWGFDSLKRMSPREALQSMKEKIFG